MAPADTVSTACADTATVKVSDLLESLPDAAFVVGADGLIERANSRATQKLGFAASEFAGRRLSDFTVSLGAALPLRSDGAPAERESFLDRIAHVRRKQGSLLTAEAVSLPVCDTPDQPPRRLTILAEVAADQRFAHVVHALYQISSDHLLGSDEKIQHILELGCHVFGLPTGIVSMVEGQCYTVVSAYSTEVDLYPGTEFELGETYCWHTLQADGPTCFHRASEQGLARHPCFEKFGLEAYIGVPLIVEGHLFGTLNFSGLKPRPSFRRTDLELSKLIAAWISQELGFTKAIASLQQQAEVDPLTGVLNRRAFERAAREILVAHGHSRQPATLVLIDIDRFKDVNGTDGHAAGDAALCGLAGICAGMFRATDPIGRLGDDEFAVILAGAETEIGQSVVETFMKRVRNAAIDGPDGPLDVTVSCGLAGLGASTDDIDTWFASANAALGEAKRCGPGTLRRHQDADEFIRGRQVRR